VWLSTVNLEVDFISSPVFSCLPQAVGVIAMSGRVHLGRNQHVEGRDSYDGGRGLLRFDSQDRNYAAAGILGYNVHFPPSLSL